MRWRGLSPGWETVGNRQGISMHLLLGILSAMGFTLALVVHALTFAHIDVSEKYPLVWVLHVGLFVVFVPLVFSARKVSGSNPEYRDFRSLFSGWGNALITVVFIYAIVNFVVFMFLSQGGVPAIRDGQFILHSHGKLVRILTEQEYHDQRAYVLRGFSGHWLVFYLVPALYFLFRKS
jgi:hypothetical protein